MHEWPVEVLLGHRLYLMLRLNMRRPAPPSVLHVSYLNFLHANRAKSHGVVPAAVPCIRLPSPLRELQPTWRCCWLKAAPLPLLLSPHRLGALSSDSIRCCCCGRPSAPALRPPTLSTPPPSHRGARHVASYAHLRRRGRQLWRRQRDRCATSGAADDAAGLGAAADTAGADTHGHRLRQPGGRRHCRRRPAAP